jgi:hypothetical protein
MPLNRDRLRQRQRETESGDSGNVKRIKDGKNFVRIFRYKHIVTERDFDLKLYRKNAKGAPKVGEEVEEIARLFYVHLIAGVSPINCMLKRSECEQCQEATSIGASGDAQGARRLRAQERNAINVVDMDNPKDGMKRIDLGPQAFNRLLEQYFDKVDDGIEDDELFGCKGRDFIINYNKSADPDKKYTVSIRDKERSDELPEALSSKVLDMHKVRSLDPQDAPPVDDKKYKTAEDQCNAEQDKQDLPFDKETRDGITKTGPDTEGKINDAVKKLDAHSQSVSADESPKIEVGKTRIEFDDGEGNKIQALVESFDGKQYVCRDEKGEPWGIDQTEPYTVLE